LIRKGFIVEKIIDRHAYRTELYKNRYGEVTSIQYRATKKGEKYLSIDSVCDFIELTKIKMAAPETGLFMVGGGTPKNFAQDTVVCAEILGYEVPMHKYAIQITVADVRDGACSSSTLLEAGSWGKVSEELQQMVYAEGTTVIPAIVSYAYHNGCWKDREYKNWQKIFQK
jgi:deoxyhypusine synthase